MTTTVNPISTLSWAEKEKNKKQWYKDKVDYFIGGDATHLTKGLMTGKRDKKLLYQVYNNKFPESWFTHVTDPLSAKVEAHKAFPAKVRPVTILRPNIDLLLGEYPRRPFIYTVNNYGETGYNAYTEELTKTIQNNVTQHFNMLFEQAMAGQPQDPDQPPPEPPPLPQDVQKKFHATYKDGEAIKAQKWLKRAMREYNIKSKILAMFKDWLIAGEAYSYKGILHGSFCYEQISPLELRHGPTLTGFVEDAEWTVVRRLMTVSDIVDRFYEVLSKEDILSMESGIARKSPGAMFSFLQASQECEDGTIPVWHVVWKARKAVHILHGTDPETGEDYQIEVDEDYKPSADFGEWTETIWPNEFYEGWRIGEKLHLGLQPIDVQRNEMNNFSACKGPYNGRKFSDTHAENISILEIGIPFQIMYIIVTRTLELTIAKSKGKIMLIDHAAIPSGDGWNEEKFFYYAEALGYGLLNRNQIGVDKSWNQYQVMDMSLFQDIKQLIELQSYFKQQWDDILGINRQRKGQTYASDLVGTTERATFQSTVMTDPIFNRFEEFVEKDLQGIIDFSKFVNVEGVKAVWNDDIYGTMLMEIDPVKYCNADLGVMVDSSTEAIAMKNKMEGTITAMLQNNVKPSVIGEIILMQNIPEMVTKLKEIEEIEARNAEAQAQGEQEAAQAADERKMKFMEYEILLKTGFMHEEYDRKDNIELLRGEFNTLTFQDGDSNDNGVPDIIEVQKHALDREKFENDRNQRNADRMEKQQDSRMKAGLKNKELDIKNKQADLQHKAAMKPTPKTK